MIKWESLPRIPKPNETGIPVQWQGTFNGYVVTLTRLRNEVIKIAIPRYRIELYVDDCWEVAKDVANRAVQEAIKKGEK